MKPEQLEIERLRREVNKLTAKRDIQAGDRTYGARRAGETFGASNAVFTGSSG
jgi:hypothetical protein